jgi:hypothetical protein
MSGYERIQYSLIGWYEMHCFGASHTTGKQRAEERKCLLCNQLEDRYLCARSSTRRAKAPGRHHGDLSAHYVILELKTFWNLGTSYARWYIVCICFPCLNYCSRFNKRLTLI